MKVGKLVTWVQEQETKLCTAFREQYTISSYDVVTKEPLYKRTCYCAGTKEQDRCSCEGDENKCNFYPEKRDLKPCPFCGGNAKLHGGVINYAQCEACGASSQVSDNKSIVYKQWNRRVKQ